MIEKPVTKMTADELLCAAAEPDGNDNLFHEIRRRLKEHEEIVSAVEENVIDCIASSCSVVIQNVWLAHGGHALTDEDVKDMAKSLFEFFVRAGKRYKAQQEVTNPVDMG